MKIVARLIVVMFFVVSAAVAQEAKKPSPNIKNVGGDVNITVNGKAKPEPAAEAAKPILLTAEEAKDLELNQKDQQILDLQIDKLQNQVAQAKQNLAKDTAALTERLAKAHNIDLTKFTLDMQGKRFVPVAGKKGS